MSPTLTVVVAPDSFKGSASASEVADAIGGGWAEARPGDTVLLRPMADGGEGTIDAFALAVPGSTRIPVRVTGPDDRPVEAEWLLLPDGTAVIELANTSGITLLDPLRPMDAHTRGFGEAIAAALDHGGAHTLLLAIGGSSSTDGGVGALTALGARFATSAGEPIGSGGAALAELASVDLSGLRALPSGGAIVVTDVTNPLFGALGAASVFGPQKGASAEQVTALEGGLENLVRVLDAASSDQPGAGVGASAGQPGAGAAGGTGFGLMLWGARIRPGAEAVGQVLGLVDDVAIADVVITGEGRFDQQSEAGKVPSFVLGLAQEHEAFPLLVAGSIGASPDEFAAYVSLTELAGSSAAAIENPLPFLWAAGRALANGTASVPEAKDDHDHEHEHPHDDDHEHEHDHDRA